MYQPAAFKVTDVRHIAAILLRAPLGQIVIANGTGFLATPAPLLINDAHNKLIGHLAKPNDVAKHAANFDAGVPCEAHPLGRSL